jgi:hypothetical protein
MKMQKYIAIIMIATAGPGSFVFANDPGLLTPSEVFSAAPAVAGKSVNDVTLEEWTAIANVVSIAKQEKQYVHHATFASALLPGTGQIMVGDTKSGVIHLGVEAAILGASGAACWFLLPSDLRDTELSHSERRALERDYMESDHEKVLPAFGVAAAGFALACVNHVFAARGAYFTATDNIASGKVQFEPQVFVVDGHCGLGMKVKIR